MNKINNKSATIISLTGTVTAIANGVYIHQGWVYALLIFQALVQYEALAQHDSAVIWHRADPLIQQHLA